MKKAIIYVFLAIFLIAAVLGFGFYFASRFTPALWIGIAALVLGLALYLYDGVLTYNEMHGTKRKKK